MWTILITIIVFSGNGGVGANQQMLGEYTDLKSCQSVVQGLARPKDMSFVNIQFTAQCVAVKDRR